MKRRALFLAACLGLARVGFALDPLPVVDQGQGFTTWTLQADRPLVKLEDAMAGLRTSDPWRHAAALRALGITEQPAGRGEYLVPEIDAPVDATAQFLSFERRKLAVLTAATRGHYHWYAVVLRQEGNTEQYWRAKQVFRFDTDPSVGLVQSFPVILGDDIRFWRVEHLVKDDIYGQAEATSLFRWDETGQMRLAYQELADAYLSAKFTGKSLRLVEDLAFPGGQRVVRTLHLRSYPWMKREEFERYLEVPYNAAHPAKAWTVRETFHWDPAEFDFYGPEEELTKLLRDPSPLVRREAARRLGEHLKTVPAGMAERVWKDKDPLVRIQVALALKAIGDPKALPAVEKALRNWNEDDAVRDALEGAEAALKPAAPGATALAVTATAQ